MIWVDMTIGSSHSEVFFKIGIGKIGKILSYDPNGHFINLMIIIIIIIIIIYKNEQYNLLSKKTEVILSRVTYDV